MTTRRHFLRTAALYSAGFVGLRALANGPLGGGASSAPTAGFGPLVETAGAAMRVPRGFRCI